MGDIEATFIRNSFALRINPGKRLKFGKILGDNWSRITERLDALEVTNFSMWEADNIVFGYFESAESHEAWDSQDKSFFHSLSEKFEGCFSWISTPWVNMQLMYEDFGIVRRSKELIRHRVFITELVPGAEQEYKARHDGLAQAKKEITKGPDSNFSIWSAGGYVFGYDEIDTTMEHEKTEVDKQAEIAWETKMLEIMKWITDDVDWITGEHHTHIRRLCYH